MFFNLWKCNRIRSYRSVLLPICHFVRMVDLFFLRLNLIFISKSSSVIDKYYNDKFAYILDNIAVNLFQQEIVVLLKSPPNALIPASTSTWYVSATSSGFGPRFRWTREQ